MKKIAKALVVISSILVLSVGLLAMRIYSFRNAVSNMPADAAIVLGAAVWDTEVSPVFRERINHSANSSEREKSESLSLLAGKVIGANRLNPLLHSGMRRRTEFPQLTS